MFGRFAIQSPKLPDIPLRYQANSLAAKGPGTFDTRIARAARGYVNVVTVHAVGCFLSSSTGRGTTRRPRALTYIDPLKFRGPDL